MSDRDLREQRQHNAEQWAHLMPDDLRHRYANDPEFHAWVKRGMQMMAASDRDVMTAEERQELAERLIKDSFLLGSAYTEVKWPTGTT